MTSFSLLPIGLICIAYMTALFGIAQLADRGYISSRIIQHPLTYVLSLGVFASSWAYYGIIELAHNYGYAMLTYYIGTGLLFLFGPILLKPILTLSQRYGLMSLVDLLAFRFQMRGVGALVTLMVIFGLLPLLVLQVQSVADSIQILTLGATQPSASSHLIPAAESHNFIALLFTLSIAVFAILFGTRPNQQGLIVALAVESFVKLLYFAILGFVAVFVVFDGFAGIDQWLVANPETRQALTTKGQSASAHTMVLLFFATAMTMPQVFKINTTHVDPMRAIRWGTWAMPLYLLIISLPVLPIYWAGLKLGITTPYEYFALGVPLALEAPALSIAVFMGGIAAATGAMIAIVLSLAAIFHTHIVLPLAPLQRQENPYKAIMWLYRGSVVFIAISTYLLYRVLAHRHSLSDLAFASFVQILQLLPAFIALTLAPKITSRGMLSGMAAGTLVWLTLLFLPMVFGADEFFLSIFGKQVGLGRDNWESVTLLSLSANVITAFTVSLYTRQSSAEKAAAKACSDQSGSSLPSFRVAFSGFDTLENDLSKHLGSSLAHQELTRAMRELQIDFGERRTFKIASLRSVLQANLSKLIGPQFAADAIDRSLPMSEATQGSVDLAALEQSIQDQQLPDNGLIRELNHLREHHRKTLDELPLGICVVDSTDEILMWNKQIGAITQASGDRMIGQHLNDVSEPWQQLLRLALSSPLRDIFETVETPHKTRHLRLRATASDTSGMRAIVFEDNTEQTNLTQSLQHAERLAAVGKLAAGVAHEIGNPVTGIACLAQEIKADSDPVFSKEAAEQILVQTDRITTIVQSLVNFSHAGTSGEEHVEPIEKTQVSLHHVVDQAIQLLAFAHDTQEISYNNFVAPSVTLVGNEQKLIQVFINLLSNARDASPAKGRIIIDCSASVKGLRVWVQDQGSGINSHDLDQVLDPFFTTKPVGEGTGLGLSLVYSIIQEHGGELIIESRHQNPSINGTRVTIIFK